MDLHATKVSYLAWLSPLLLFLRIDSFLFLPLILSPRDNYVIQCNESTDCSDLYIQTEIKDLRINGPLPLVQCQEENSTDVVSIALESLSRVYQCTDLKIKSGSDKSWLSDRDHLHVHAIIYIYFPVALPFSVPFQVRIFNWMLQLWTNFPIPHLDSFLSIHSRCA